MDGGHSFVGTDFPLYEINGEGPKRPVQLKPYGLSATCVTNQQFADFVADTGYITLAEEIGTSFVFQGMIPQKNHKNYVAVPNLEWWLLVPGASWQRPFGPDSNVAQLQDHPVTQVGHRDVLAFAAWAGGRLPTEAEWEHAAHGGQDMIYPWGDAHPDDETIFCNIWQGNFPKNNTGADGYIGTAPVKSFKPNSKGFYNMVGNVWEWSSDIFKASGISLPPNSSEVANILLKGGSHLCHDTYCFRYRIAARIGQPSDSTTTHIGFRMAYTR
jgi:formylglycine-generating enzyme required for sulfatase activity